MRNNGENRATSKHESEKKSFLKLSKSGEPVHNI